MIYFFFCVKKEESLEKHAASFKNGNFFEGLQYGGRYAENLNSRALPISSVLD
jgi:hypothetical protein